MGDLTLEIYPSDAKTVTGCAGMIGISVNDIGLSLDAMEPHVRSPIAPFGNGRRCIVNDPDGCKVFVYDHRLAGKTDQ